MTDTLAALARLWPRPVEADEELARALRFLGWSTEPATLVRAGRGLGVAVGVVGLALAPVVLPPGLGLAGVLGALAAGLLVSHAVEASPRLAARAVRTRALGATPALLARVVLRMRLSPAPEQAAAVAADAGEGRLATSLRRHVAAARGTPATGLARFTREWRPWFPALGRATTLVAAAGEAREGERRRLLDRALAAVMDGVRDEMASFAAGIRGPTTALYAFGVLLPTALVALLPAARAAGLAVTPPALVVVYDLLLPLALTVAAAWLVARRPVTFPPPRVGPDHPDVPDRRRVALGVAAGTGALAWLLAGAVLPPWGPPVLATGVGPGLALVVYYRPMVRTQRTVRAVEAGLADALAHVGRRVTSGTAVEAALREAADEVDGPMGEVLAAGSRRQHRLGLGVRAAFLGEDGALAAVPSRRVRGSFALLETAGSEGRPAGPALLSLAEHLDDLREIERDARRGVEQVCGTLRTTGMVFGPLVAGATVALAGRMTGGPLGGGSVPWLGHAVGWYVLALAVLLPALATGLTHGFDRPLVGYRVGGALAVAVVVYALAYLVTRGLA